jgi:hypothetical protein
MMLPMRKLKLSPLPDIFGICRLDASGAIPAWATTASFFAVTRTADELSIISPQANVPDDVQCSRGWRALKVEGPLDFSVVGVVASLSTPLAAANIPIFVVSTYDTDYLLVAGEHFEQAVRVLAAAGHGV